MNIYLNKSNIYILSFCLGLASYNYQKFLSPKLGNSHLIFTDILLDTDSKKVCLKSNSLLKHFNFLNLNHELILTKVPLRT